MHGRRVHLKGSQLFERILRERVGLKAEDLAKLHRRALERLQFLADEPGSFLLKSLLTFVALFFAKPEILCLVTEITAGKRQAELSKTESACERARLNDFFYQSQPPFFKR